MQPRGERPKTPSGTRGRQQQVEDSDPSPAEFTQLSASLDAVGTWLGAQVRLPMHVEAKTPGVHEFSIDGRAGRALWQVDPKGLPSEPQGRKPVQEKAELTGDKVFQFKITLNGSWPEIWRRIQVRVSASLEDLHDAIQAAMGWEGWHSWGFKMGKRYLADVCGSPNDITLMDLGLRTGSTLLYHYNFTDDWKHTVRVEKTLPSQPDVQYPVCLAAERACPPEDFRGVWRYNEFVESLPQRLVNGPDGVNEKRGGGFDPEFVDMDRINKRMRPKPPAEPRERKRKSRRRGSAGGEPFLCAEAAPPMDVEREIHGRR